MLCVNMLTTVASDTGHALITVIQAMLEYLNILFGDTGPTDSAQQFFCLATEHAAADDLDGSDMMTHCFPLN
jgi:hypothetical protein